jgi:hypothetical protein
MKTFLIALLLLAGCQSVPESKTIAYRAVSTEENARALKAITRCLSQPDCPELLGERLDCGPFLWRQLNVPALSDVITFTLPQNVAGGSQEVTWEGRRCDSHEQALTLWRAFAEKVPLDSLQTMRSLNDAECRIYNALVPGEIREPVFIVEGAGHKILMQLAPSGEGYRLTFLDDFRNVVIRD